MIEDRSYYSSCVVHLTMRYDEALQVDSGENGSGGSIASTHAELTAPAGDPPPSSQVSVIGTVRTISTSAGRPRAKLVAAFNTVPAIDSSGQQTVKPGATGGRPLTPLVYGSDGFTVIGSRVPLAGSFTLPHPREAGQFTVTFDYQDLPIDPRILRAAGVEIHIGTVSADNYARGMAGERDSDGRPLSILRTRLDQLDPATGRQSFDPSTLLFFGSVDEWKVTHALQGGSMVRLQGRDLRGILIDAKYTPEKIAKVDLKQPVDLVIANLIKTIGLDHDLNLLVVTDVAEWPNQQVPSPGDADGLTRVRQKASGEGAASTPANGTKASYWDLITNYCELVGGMPQFRGTTLWIRPVKSVFDILMDTAIATPFRGGRARSVGDEEIRARRLVYGRDLVTLEFSRKFQGTVVPTIRCVSFDDRTSGSQRMIFGQWPPSTSEQAQAKSDKDMLTVPMYGVRSVERLKEIARGVYEELGRGETGGMAETGLLASYGGDNADPDLLTMRPMEPIEFTIDARLLQSRAPLVSTLNNIERQTFSQEVDALTERLGDRDLARALTALSRGALRELLQFYQVIGMQFDWKGATGGTAVQFTFQNYIVPRQQPEASVATTAAVRKTQANVPGQNRAAQIKGEAVGGMAAAGAAAFRKLSPEAAGKLRAIQRRMRNVKK